MPREAKKSVAGSSQRGIPNTSITLADKFDILKKMEEGVSVRSIMAEYNMGKSTVYNLKNDRAKLHKFQRESSEGIAEKRTRLLFADKYKDIEQATLRWYKQRRGAGVPIRGIEIKNAAKRFADLFDIAHFRASSGWLFRFERRHGLVYKRIMGTNMADEPMGPLGQNPLDHQAYLIRNAINMRIRDRCRLVKTLDWARARGCLAPVPTWLEIQGLMEESLQAAVTGLGIKILGTLCAGAKSTATKVRLRFLAARKFTDTMYAELCLYMDSCLARLGSERTIAPGHGNDAKEMEAPGGGPSGGMRIMRDDEDSGAPKAKRRGFEDGGCGPPRKKVKKTKMEQATSVMGDLVMDTMEALEERSLPS
uniref:HTH CENPB-type domain-containing protein n=1 Tax=Eptatretus burgeri TaxID=7764 RepID=A0A8C4NNQ2_EPTBU